MKKLKIFVGALIMLTVLGLNFQKSNEKTSKPELALEFFSTNALAGFGVEYGISYQIPSFCSCPWFDGGGCQCHYTN
jgi:hypothetical protein